MVLEPDVIARMVIADYLRGCGFKVIEGTSAQDAFEALSESVAVDILGVDSQASAPGAVVRSILRELQPSS